MWKDIEGYEGIYQVSDTSNIRSLKYGNERILKSSINNCGYKSVTLSKNANRTSFRINRLVAIAFIPNPEKKPFVNHKNGIKTDNRVENLEWVTASENTKHAYDTGLKKVPRNHHFYIKNPSKGKFGKDSCRSRPVIQYSKESGFIREWDSIADIQRELGIKQSNIIKCCRLVRKTAGGYIWKYL